MYIHLMAYFLYSLQLLLQFSFITTCYYQGSQNGTNYNVDVWDIFSIDTLNFTKSSAKSNASKVLMTKRHKPCKYIWMEDSQSMLLGPVLQCKMTMKAKHNHQVDFTQFTCTLHSGDNVCSNSTSQDRDGECV